MTDTAIPFRASGFAPRSIPALGAAALVGLVAFWQAGSYFGFIPEIILPAPYEVARAFWQLGVSGELWRHVSASLVRLVVGWITGTLAGLVVGFAIGMFTAVRSPGLAIVSALFPIPKIALIPLFIIWFGIGEASKIITIAFGVFFPTAINTYGGVANVQRTLIRMGQSFNMTSWSIIRKIVLPGALPAILSGFRITTSVAILLLVAAEMIGAQHGIGAFILAAGNLYQVDRLLAGVVLLSVLGLTASAAITFVERRLLDWR